MRQIDIITESRKRHTSEVIIFPWGLATGPSTERKGKFNVYHIKSGEIVVRCTTEAHAANCAHALRDLYLVNWHWTRPQSIAFAAHKTVQDLYDTCERFKAMTAR